MKLYIKFFLILLICTCSMTPELSAQRVKQAAVSFSLIRSQIFNDTMMFHRLRVEGTTQEGASIIGTVTLGLCYCYCDSLVDAWPDEFGSSFDGTGTISFISSTPSFAGSSAGSDIGRRLRGRGSLGIKQVKGGILREDEFVLPIRYAIEIK